MSKVNNSGLLLARLDLIDADENDIHTSWVRVSAREAAARIRALEQQVARDAKDAERYRLALLAARKAFRRYAQLHMDKGTVEATEKALANHALAEEMEAALAAQPSTPAEDGKV